MYVIFSSNSFRLMFMKSCALQIFQTVATFTLRIKVLSIRTDIIFA
jgi:hypothetical protein